MKIGVDVVPLAEKKTGVGNYLFYLLDPLIRLRPYDQFFLYTFRNCQDLEQLSQYSNVCIRRSKAFSFSEALWSQSTLSWMAYRDGVDIFWGATQSLPLFKRHKQRTLITIYDFAYLLYPKTVSRVRGTYLRLFCKHFCKNADKIVTISQGTCDKLELFYSRKADAVIIPPIKPSVRAWNEEELSPWLKQQNLDYGNYVITVGTLEPRKNIGRLLTSYLELLNESDHLLPLLIIGAKGWRNHILHTHISNAAFKYPDKIRSLGYVDDDDLYRYISGARYYIMPSLYEGYGMPIAEARCCNTPVVCMNVPEMIEAAEYDAHIIFNCSADELKSIFQSNQRERLRVATHYSSNIELAEKISLLIDSAINVFL
jgi:glycosyltransferase involved in cell wall biosynthesis